VDVAEVNKVLKMHRQMEDAMKAMKKGGMKGLMGMLQGQGLPPGVTPPGGMGGMGGMGGLGGMGGSGGTLPGLPGPGGKPTLPGLPGGKPTLPGLPGGGKKK
jgi:signal recognition particle subunit SRP54